MSKTMLEVMDEMLANGIDPESRERELWERFGQQCAVAAIDSSGFSRTTREHGIIHTLSKLTQKRGMMVPILKKHGCTTYVTEADSIVALFPDVHAAMDAVVEASKALHEKPLMLSPDEQYKICVGIGYGTLLVTGAHGEFFGPEMNLASKLGEDTAEADQLLLTEAAYQAISDERKAMFRQQAETVSGNHIVHFSTKM